MPENSGNDRKEYGYAYLQVGMNNLTNKDLWWNRMI